MVDSDFSGSIYILSFFSILTLCPETVECGIWFVASTGGILFKVYIIGETVQVVRRFSLPDVNTYDLLNNVGIYRLPRVSCAAASADGADLDPLIVGETCAASLFTFFINIISVIPLFNMLFVIRIVNANELKGQYLLKIMILKFRANLVN